MEGWLAWALSVSLAANLCLALGWRFARFDANMWRHWYGVAKGRMRAAEEKLVRLCEAEADDAHP